MYEGLNQCMKADFNESNLIHVEAKCTCDIDIVILCPFFYDNEDKHLVEVDPNITKHKYSNNLSKNLVKEKLEGLHAMT